MLIDTDQFATKRIAPGECLPGDKSALVIVDMMNLFCDARWLAGGDPERAAWFEAELAAVIPSIGRVLDAFRGSGGLVVHVMNARWTHDGREVVAYQRGRDYDLFDTPKMSLIEPLAARPGEIIVRKVASSAFSGTGLEFMLRNAAIEHVVLTGQFGDACVFYTLIHSREAGFGNIWVEDGLVYSSEMRKHVIAALVGSAWAQLASADEVVRAMSTLP